MKGVSNVVQEALKNVSDSPRTDVTGASRPTRALISGEFKATIGFIFVSHQGFPFISMRAGGHYHYTIVQ